MTAPEETQHQSPWSAYPWGTLLASIGGIMVAHAAGHAAAGGVLKVLAASKLGPRFAAMHPERQHAIIGAAMGIAGSIVPVAAGLAHLAAQHRIEEERARLEQERQKALPGSKVASVCDAYIIALSRMPE